MKKLLLTLLLLSPFSFADWGDVYYCQMTGHITLDGDGTINNYKLEKFQFKLDKTKNALVFGENSREFLPSFILVNPLSSVKEEWLVLPQGLFIKGKFKYAYSDREYIQSITANCDKF